MNHDELEGLSKDDHKQYIYCNPTADTRNYILPNQATTVGLTIKGALGQKADLIRIQSFKGGDLASIKADGSIRTPKVESNEATLETLYTKQIESSNIHTDVLQAGSISSGQINGININEFKSGFTKHEQDKNIHYQQQDINHEVIQNRGKYNHKAIDQHLDRGDIHYPVDKIEHGDIKGIGKKTHQEIDAHIADKSLHFKEGDIRHGAIQGLQDDHHQQYVLASGSRPMKTLTVDKEVEVKGSLNATQINTGGLGANSIRAPYSKLEQLDASTVKSHILYCNKSEANESKVKDLYAHNLEIRDDVVINGRLYCEDVQGLRDEMEAHRQNLPAKETHKAFSRTVDGFVPAPKTVTCHDHLFMTSKGNWKSIGQYAEFCYMKGELCESITDRVYKWKTKENTITIPVRGVYEITLCNIPQIEINQKIVTKSLYSDGNPFLLDLDTDGVTLSLTLSEDYSRIYIKKIDDYWSYI